MTTLRKIQVLLAVVHIACAIVQWNSSYQDGFVSNYGLQGWLAATPLGSHFDLEGADGSHDVALANIPGFFRFFFDLGDTVNSLAWISYDWMSKITEANLVYLIIVGLRLFSIVVWGVTALALIAAVFRSNMTNSRIGLFLMLGGLGILSGMGAFGPG